MKIGQMAEATGLPIRTLRFYEDAGLLPQRPRTEAGYRIFDERDLERLEFVKKAKRLGLSLGEIKDILAITDRGEATCTHVCGLLASRVEELDRAISELGQLRTVMVDLLEKAGPIEDCRPTGGRVCAIIECAPSIADATGLRFEAGAVEEAK